MVQLQTQALQQELEARACSPVKAAVLFAELTRESHLWHFPCSCLTCICLVNGLLALHTHNTVLCHYVLAVDTSDFGNSCICAVFAAAVWNHVCHAAKGLWCAGGYDGYFGHSSVSAAAAAATSGTPSVVYYSALTCFWCWARGSCCC